MDLSAKQSHTETSSSVKETKHHKISVVKIIFYIIIAAVCDALVILAASASQQKQSLIYIFALSTIPSIVIGFAFAVMEHFENRSLSLQESIEEIERLSASNNTHEKRLTQTIDDFHILVKDAGITLKFYANIRKLLEDGYAQQDLIRAFLSEAMNRPLFIQPMEAYDFYDLAKKGIKQCSSSWQAIHQGSIKNLEVNFPYLDELKKERSQVEIDKHPPKALLKQRIVILEKPEEIDELQDYNTVAHFLEATEGTDSYYVKSEAFIEEFDVPKGKIDDAALHDENLLILRRRELKLVMLALPGHNDKIYESIIKAFDKLNYDLQRDPLLKRSIFHRISLPNSQ